ncbi:MAG TPA: hypothetical protein VHD60_02180 [Candidatus Saccharimonadales bacterium]|nr:hypothetical protein [Candidatus Saccharimonadales bacterium]
MRIRLTPITWFVLLALIGIGLALGLPPDPHTVSQLHTTAAAYRIAIATLLIPYVLIWYASFYAFAKLQEYSRPLKDTKDGAAFQKVTWGMGVLAFSLVVPTIISLIVGNIAMHDHAFGATAVIIRNYVGLFPGLLAFLLLYNGTRALADMVRGKTRRLDLRWHAPWFFLLCIVFSHLVIENSYHHNPYHLRVWLLVITFIVPYLYGWMLGLLCAYNLHVYARGTKGVLYQRAVKRLAHGITVTIIGSIAIQFANITIAHRLRHSLGGILLIDYGLLIIIALGLVLMALATKKLKRIEEI